MFYIVSLHSLHILFFNLLWINQTEWWTIPACRGLTCFFNEGSQYGRDCMRRLLKSAFDYDRFSRPGVTLCSDRTLKSND